ncbi:hypothetical protein [Kangiella sp.]|uniref:hypothetical protein n=1 Tax=Kangiella sp. TaxID=1920245 RepID=UPI003A9001D2
MKRFLLLFVLLITSSLLPAAAAQIDTISFDLDIQVQIYQPDPTLEHDQEKFPTLYIIDGQHFIHSAIGYQRSLNWRNSSSPEFIVVAIDTHRIGDSSARRRELLNQDSVELIDLIEKDIVPYVDEHYPASNMRLFAGWEHAGGFALDLLTTRPDLFDSFLFASSPNLSAERLKNVEQLFASAEASKDTLNKRLYLALGSQENYAIEGFDKLKELSHDYPSQLEVHYKLSSDLSHFTTPIDLFTSGLAWVFADYPALIFYDINEIHAFGGVPAVKDYFAKRGQRYHVSSTVSENTKFTMARHAVDANDLELFLAIERDLEKLDQQEFPPYWGHFFANFLLKHDQLQRAEEIIRSVLSRHPEIPQLIELNKCLHQQK